MSKQARMTLRRANTLPSNSLLSSISSWGDGVMAPPPLPLRPYVPTHPTDFNPLDLLEGTMDLAVTLPSGKKVVMNVYRSTPMMDLMVQVTTAHHINPGGHVIQVISDNLSLSYKPSTPIGTLDTNAIKVVAKNKINEMAQRRKLNLHQEAVERNIRLKPKEWVFKQQLVVNLPHNQLAVYRVPPKALISDIFAMICEDKNLDCESHEMRHPVNLDERLRGSCSLSDYQLRELCVVSSDFRPPPLSVTDLITMSSIAHPEDKKRRSFLGLFSRKAKSSTGDSSVSSGSAGERSVSPARSDDSAESHPTPQPLSAASSSGTLTNVNSSSGPVRNEAPCRTSVSLHNSMTSIHSPPARMSRPVSMISLNRSRKRPAPIPPQVEGGLRGQEDQSQYRDALKIQINGKVNSGKEKQSLSRHSSDSSGYHESNVKSSQTSPSGSEVGPLEAPKKPLPSSNLSATASGSILSISSVSKGKRKAPSPPKAPMNGEGPCAIPESPEEVESREGTRSCEVEEEVGVSRNVEEKSENKGPSYQEEREAGATTTSPHFEKHLETKQPHPPSTETCSVVTDFSHDHNSSTSTTTALPTSLRDTPDNTSSPTLPDIAHNDTPSIAPAVDPYVVHPSSFQVGGGDQPPSCPSQISSECTYFSVDCSTLPSPSQTPALFQHLKEAPTRKIFALHSEPTFLASAPTPLRTGLKTTRRMTQSPPSSDSKANNHSVASHLRIEADLKSSTPNRLSAAGNNKLAYKHRAKKGPKERSSGERTKYTENTIPRTAKKILERIPLFGSLSRKKIPKNDHLSTLSSSETHKIDPKLSSSSYNESVGDTYKANSNIFLAPQEAEDELNLKIDISELKTSNSGLSYLANDSNSFDSQNSLCRENIDSTPHEIDRIQNKPIPIPRKTNPDSVIPAPRNIFSLPKSSVELPPKANSFPSNVDKPNIISERRAMDNPPVKKCSNHIPNQVSNLGSLKSWKTTGDLNNVDGSPLQSNVALRSSLHLEYGASWKSSAHTSSSPRSLSYDAENDTHPDVESLSLETTDVEMLNPKDIQRPKRQKRKRIPEEFLKKSPQNDSSGSSCEKSLERINHDKTSDGNLALESSNAEQNREKSNHLPNHNSDEVSEDKMISLQSASENGDLEGSVNEACNGDVATPLSHPSVLYVEMISEEETSTDPVPPVRASKQSYTSKVQLSLNTQTQNPVNHDSTGSRPAISISRLTSSESSSFPTEEVKTEISKVDVIAELKSAIEASSDEDHPPRILNFKPKGKDWNDAAQTTSDYNVILSFGNSDSSTRVGPVREASMTSSSSGEGKSVTRSSSSTSYESIDNSCHVSSEVSKANSATTVRDSRSNTESSYESAPPPLPESRIPVISDSSSKTSSATVSRQSSFSDYDSQSSPPEFVKPRAPAFSISTYQSRASKVSYDKKLSRSESLSSVKDLHGQGTGDCHRRKGVVDEEKASEGGSPSRRLCRSGSQRNEIFRSDDIRKKSTSTTFLNSPVGEWNEIKSTNGPIRPSFVKSQSRSSLLESGANDASKTNQHGCVQFELSSAKDSVIFPRPFGKPLPQLRKTRSTFDIRAPEGKISEGYQTIPDSGLANEYIRLQDDFMKWQNQLLQNQQILHNRVAPIAANPPTLNSVGRYGRGLRLGWKTATPWMVSNMMNQMPTDAPAQKRKPIEISIPIRLEDSDDDDREPLRQTQPTRRVREPVQPTKGPQGNHPETESNLWTKGPSVPIGAWQERPMPPRGDATERMRPQASDMPRPFGQPSGMVTFAPQAAPQGRCPPSPPQQMSQGFHQQMPHSGYQQMPQSGYQQMPQSGYQQMPQSGYQQMPQSNYQQMPQSNYQQMPQSGYQQVPQTSFQQSSSQPGTRNQPVLYDPREEVFHNGDEGINARFSSVVTLNKDKDDQNSALAKDKVRSVVQLNNTAEPAPQARSGAPFHSRIISASSREPDMEEVRRSPSGNPPAGGFAGTPMSSRLVQQAVQQPLGRSNVSPPKMERLPSPPQVMRRPSPPKMERHPSPPKEPSPEPQPSPPPFAGVKLRPVESRVSPPKTVIPQPPLPSDVFGPPPPPPPPSKVPQAPPPPPGMPEDRRTSTGKKIISSTNAPQLDARQELMMAIRQFGGSSNLKRSVYPPPGVPKSS